MTLRTVYGISEAGSTVTMTPPGQGATEPGDVGLPVWHLQRRVAIDGKPCSPGEAGDLQIAGASVSPGYWRRPEESARAIVDGWLHTGDAAIMDVAGHIEIVDRIKDMYISGERISR